MSPRNPSTLADTRTIGPQNVHIPSQARALTWLRPALTAAKATEVVAGLVPVPGVAGVFKTITTVLKTIQKAEKNHQDLKNLHQSIVMVQSILQQQWSDYGPMAPVRLKDDCANLESTLKAALQAITKLRRESEGIGGHLKDLTKVASIKDEIARHEKNIRDMCDTITVCHMISPISHSQPRITDSVNAAYGI
ncbi:hypothetical protein DFH06DRAFT_1347390 [Mycena polygramma]|nr:hypothetical protein DFH06DRAFT_1347390 [Mycena polygramma]